MINSHRILSVKERRQVFYSFLFIISAFLFLLTGIINYSLNHLFFPKDGVSINGTKIDILGSLIAPVTEESIKLLGYGIIFIFNFNKFFRLGYRNRSDFIKDSLPLAFFISAGGFGFFEGFKNIRFIYSCPFCVPSFIILNMLIHMTYSIYPLILGSVHRNHFVAFLPIAMLLHSLHNSILDVLWDNKWVTFSMVTMFLFPVLHLNREKIFSFLKRYLKGIGNKQIFLFIFLIYFYIFICILSF